MDWAREATKDKYLMLILCGILLIAYIKTKDPVLQTLLVTAIGGFLAMVKAGSSGITQTGSPAVASIDTKTEKIEEKKKE